MNIPPSPSEGRRKPYQAEMAPTRLERLAAKAERERLKRERRLARRQKAKAKVKAKKKPTRRRIDPFFSSQVWKVLRYEILKRDGAICKCCGVTPEFGAVMNVDHIKPRLRYPELALDPNNLQVLCANCNAGKWGLDETDWRTW
jgi:5-methylcytosine-specific restriction endonuclease McrA